MKTNMTNFKASRKQPAKIALIFLASIIIVVALVLILEKKDVIDLYGNNQPADLDEAKTTSTAPTAQEDFSDGNARQPSTATHNEGTVQDNNGQVANTPAPSQWSVSSDKKISVYLPSKNSIVKSGGTLSGESTLARINFRLIDDVSGVISQGSLAVVNGKYSGTFNFTTSGNQGRLDVFYASEDGVESSNVEVPVRFK